MNIKTFGPFKMDVQEQFHKIQGKKLIKNSVLYLGINETHFRARLFRSCSMGKGNSEWETWECLQLLAHDNSCKPLS